MTETLFAARSRRAKLIRFDGVYRPAPYLSLTEWIAQAYTRDGRHTERHVRGETRRGRFMPFIYPSEEEAQDACDEANASAVGRVLQLSCKSVA